MTKLRKFIRGFIITTTVFSVIFWGVFIFYRLFNSFHPEYAFIFMIVGFGILGGVLDAY